MAVGGVMENFTQDITNWIATNIIRYKKEFKGEHSVEAFAGYDAQRREYIALTLRVNGIARLLPQRLWLLHETR